MRRKRTFTLRHGARYSCLPFVLASCVAFAETPPDAGQLHERNREALQVQPIERPRIEAAQVPTAPGAVAAVLVPVRQIRIIGASLFSESVLHSLVADAEGSELSLADLQAIAARLTRYYGKHGYLLARAYVPPQEIKDGLVTLAVLEGRVEGVESENDALLSNAVLHPLYRNIHPGKPLRRADLERAVLLMDSLPGIAASARLRPGEGTGGTVVVLETSAREVFAGEVTVDNYGDRYTGDLQAGVRAEWNNPAGIGDQIALRLQSAGKGRVYGRIAYDLPLCDALRLTAAASSTRYELGEEFGSLEADGWARTASLDLRYPFIVTSRVRLNGFVGSDFVSLVDRINLVGSERNKDLVDARVGVNLQASDAARGQTALLVQFTSGRVDIHAPAEQAFDASTVGSEGGFGKINAVAERWQALPAEFQLRGSASLQIALSNLTSAQKLAIGGANGVRAYPVGEAQGDSGELYSLELRRAVPFVPRWSPTMVAFADYGRVEFNHDTWAGFSGVTGRELTAAGVGIEWTGPGGLGLSAYQAWPIRNEPIIAEPDGNYRTWVQAHLRF